MYAAEFLDRRVAKYKLMKHEPALQCKDSAAARGVSEKQIVKSIVVEGPMLVCLPGNMEISSEKLGRKMVGEEKVKEITGFEIGTVHPFANLHKLIDRRVFENEFLSFTNGKPDEGIIIAASEFKKALLDYEVADVALDVEEKYAEIAARFGIKKHDAEFLCKKNAIEYYEKIKDIPGAIKWLRFLERVGGLKISAAELRSAIERKIPDAAKKDIIYKLAQGEKFEAKDIDINEIIQKVIHENEKAVADRAVDYLIGKIIKESHGAADPKALRKKLEEILSKK